MLTLLQKYWWLLAVRGVLAVSIGAAAFAWPGITLTTLVLFFGSYVFVDGAFTIVNAIAARKSSAHWGLMLFEGLVGVTIGVLTFQAPVVTAVALVVYIAAWWLITGLLRVIAAIRLRKEIEGEIWLGLSGLASIAAAVVLLVAPGAGALALLWVIASFAIVFGVSMVLLAFKIRMWTSRVAPRVAANGWTTR